MEVCIPSGSSLALKMSWVAIVKEQWRIAIVLIESATSLSIPLLI